MLERLSAVDRWNFAKLEVRVVKLSLQDKFVLEFRKVVCAQRLPRDGPLPKMGCVF